MIAVTAKSSMAAAAGLILVVGYSFAADPGSITGTVKFEGAAPKMKKIKMQSEQICHEQHKEPPRDESVIVNANGTLMHVFVSIKSGPSLDGKTFEAPKSEVTLDQKGCMYHPHVFGVMVGQPVKILNSDMKVLHNVHTFSEKGNAFNKGMPGTPGASITETFKNAESPLKIKCDVHAWMTGYAHVMTHPFYSVTNDKGEFTIGNLLPGDYVVEALHEKYGTATANVKVEATGAATTSFTFKGEAAAAPAPSPAK